jgi:site-specific DNA-methyltransferase (adenine-specific)
MAECLISYTVDTLRKEAIDKAAGAEREVVGSYTVGGTAAKGKHKGRAAAASDEGAAIGCTKDLAITAPATPEAQQWAGWGTALKPALEPITMARKPLEGTVAACVLEHGTGALNVDGCRVGTEARPVMVRTETVVSATAMSGQSTGATSSGELTTAGRWPANLVHDGSDEVVGLFPQATGAIGMKGKTGHSNSIYGNFPHQEERSPGIADTGSAARFFYTAKASKADREDGNTHPTVKPTGLMRYLCRLVTPPGGVVLDPFAGSGSTGKAAELEGFDSILIEQDPASYAIAKQRISRAQAAGHQPSLFA